jgi:hypothetical protein
MMNFTDFEAWRGLRRDESNCGSRKIAFASVSVRE